MRRVRKLGEGDRKRERKTERKKQKQKEKQKRNEIGCSKVHSMQYNVLYLLYL